MNFIQKLFRRNKAEETSIEVKEPDNARLKFFLSNYNKNPTQENYQIAFDEIVNGNTELYVPMADEDGNPHGRGVAEAGSILKMTSSFDFDGLKVLGVFTDEKTLVAWSKRKTHYFCARSADVIQLCKDNNVGRIVIDSDQPTMFVLERDRSNIQSDVIKEDTPVRIGFPIHPLPEELVVRLINSFKKVTTIVEAYQFLMERNGEQTITLGINVSKHTEDARYAINDAMNDALAGLKLDYYIDLIILDERWLASVRSIPNSIFYKKDEE